ncbi:class I SAM-dependent methyltransferase [Streptomyces sp. SR27]|uniref:class I SAM-dependent methyltransferase n=1 Tax=Streptomyces sp. SR27 TaxID=3076630 RepID=UPI00295B8293|nr:class I SAM-dependent methyltransferase [Streptomyces sp. SR27]MDV9189684.1 class I SAM-dependent methyltransferase [Streptomyces sp. SR27]
MPDDSPASWLDTFFTSVYTDSDLELRDAATTEAMVRCVSAALGPAPGAALMDLACGTGRHSVPLAAAGYRVTGVDLMPDYLDEARARARRAGQQVDFVQADMRNLEALPSGSFDAVVSLHTSFGFFDTDEENLAVLAQIRQVLAPGGKLLIDVMNRDWFLSQSGESFGVEPHDFVVRNFDSSSGTTYLYEERFAPLTSRVRWHIRSVENDPANNGRERTVTADYRVYSAHELAALLTRAGFEILGLHGDYDLAPFHVHSPHLILTATTTPREN